MTAPWSRRSACANRSRDGRGSAEITHFWCGALAPMGVDGRGDPVRLGRGPPRNLSGAGQAGAEGPDTKEPSAEALGAFIRARRSCSALTPIALLRDRPVKQQLHLGLEVASMSPQRADGSQLPRLCPSRHCLRVNPEQCRDFGRCEQRLCIIRSHCHEAPLGLFAMNCVLCVFVWQPARAPQPEAAV